MQSVALSRRWLCLNYLLAACCGLVSVPRLVQAQALSPDEALKHFKVADGFEVQLFASEPMIRQPVTMTFDDRGRMWVIQYLQYPTPAGLKPVEVDRYLRTRYDRVPEPPPTGPVGVDKITILEDTDGDGHADKAKDFVGGLNLASALAIGNGGVYVGQAPYLLFYPDRNRDDVPDGDPEVLLKGFGLEDAHAVINSLQWGPDGWLYGNQGSTVTADIRGIGFQQGIWRYHPETKRFELFSEGGGNTWGLDFDRHGNAIAGTNYGNVLGLHQVQGAYYVKGFSKHGPLHNPYSYGYFEHMAHSGFAGGHVTCGGIVYQGGAWPESFTNCYVSANLLSNGVYWSAIEPAGSTYKTRYIGILLDTDDIWFRPIDCLTGPDGSVYVADWYDQRANHVIPDDTWDKTNGRVWKLVARGTKAVGAFNLSKQTSDELVDLLTHANAWQRREARRILSERRDASVLPRLQTQIAEANEQLALESLWAFYVSGGWNDQAALKLLDHQNADIRTWAVRFIGDDKRALPPAIHERLVQLAKSDPSVTVRSQLACTAKRLLGNDGLPIAAALLARSEDAGDLHLPLLLWWAIEDKALTDRDQVLAMFNEQTTWQLPLVHDVIVERVARRYLAERSDPGYQACARLLALAPTDTDRLRLVSAMDADFSGHPLTVVPSPLAGPLEKLWQRHSSDPNVIRFALRMGSQSAYERAIAWMSDARQPESLRLPLISAVGQTTRPDALPKLLALLDKTTPASDAVRLAALAALGHFGQPTIGEELFSRYEKQSPAVRDRIIALAASRGPWSQALMAAVATGQVNAQDVAVDTIRRMLAHGDETLNLAIETRWGKIRPATPGEKMSYVPVLGRVLNAGQGDLESGHKLFMKHCGVCHTLHGEGTKIGPDLTSADRKNRDALLLNILDPSGTIRPEFISQTAVLVDGRILTGLVVEATPQQLTIIDAKQQKTIVPRSEIDQIEASSLSLMPERLLEQLQEQEIRDLFRYLQSEAPATGNAAASAK